MKNSLAKGKIRLISYVAIVGSLAISALVLFVLCLYKKAQYQASNVVLTGAESQLKLLEKEEQTDLVRDKIAWYTDIRDHFVVVNEQNYNTYKALSIPAYALSTLALISFGLCLKFEDKAKAKEEKD
ncbi:MAG: hypothetical protein IJQ92_02790 [Bacilli bacterium]|nr:hypothetical protein [Bacilli bacterium]